MNKIKAAIWETDFRKQIRRLVALSIFIEIVGILLSVIMFWPQITGAASAFQEAEQNLSLQEEFQNWHGEHDEQGRRDEYDRDRHEPEHEEYLRAILRRVPDPSVGAIVTVGAWGLFTLLLLAAWHLLIAAWLLREAARAQMNSWFWCLLGALIPWVALPFFLILRGFWRQYCENCGQWQKKAFFCSSCGSPLLKKCPSCGTECRTYARFCASCGKVLSAQPGEKNTEEEGKHDAEL